MLKPVPSPRITRQVQEQLMALLDSGKFEPGARLPSLREMTDALGVSRTAVREGLRGLEALGLVEIRHGSGIYMADGLPPLTPEAVGLALSPNSRKIARELLEVRLTVEPQVSAFAAMRATDQDIEKLRRHVDDLRARIGTEARPASDMQFHLDLCEAAHNAPFKAIMKWIARFYANSQKLPEMQDVVDHERIYNAILRRDPDAARAAMTAHLRWVRDWLEREHLDMSGPMADPEKSLQ